MIDAHSRLMERIYDAIIDDDASRGLPCHASQGFETDAGWTPGTILSERPIDVPRVLSSRGIDDGSSALYSSGGYRIYARREAAGEIPLNQGVAKDRFVSPKTFEASALYNDLPRGRADISQCVGLAIKSNRGTRALAMQRGQQRKTFDERDETSQTEIRRHVKSR